MLPNKKETIQKMVKIVLEARNLSKLNNNYSRRGRDKIIKRQKLKKYQEPKENVK